MIAVRSTTVLTLGVAAIAVLVALPARAGIITTSGQVRIATTPPTSVLAGDFANDRVTHVFAEQQDLLLQKRIAVDASLPGSYVNPADFTPDFIPRHTSVNSYLLHADQTGGAGNPKAYSGSITFDSDILGVIFLDDHLDTTDDVLGLSSTTYPNQVSLRGLEVDPIQHPNAPDSFTISADRRTLTFAFLTGTSVDQARIVTAAVPEPASLLGFGLGLAGLAGRWFARRRFDQ